MAFCELISDSRDKKFVIVTGGGRTARSYQNAARKIIGEKYGEEALDWLGIAATKLNAILIETLLEPIACPYIVDREPDRKAKQTFLESDKTVLMACGWEPGWSTDYVAASCAGIFGAKEIIVVGDTAFVCDKDPHKHTDARQIKAINWPDYKMLIPSEWKPGMSAPIDPIAARLSMELGLTAKIVGPSIKSIRNAIYGRPFEGTTISPV